MRLDVVRRLGMVRGRIAFEMAREIRFREDDLLGGGRRRRIGGGRYHAKRRNSVSDQTHKRTRTAYHLVKG